MAYEKIGITPSTVASRPTARTARHVGNACMLGLLLVVTACAAAPLAVQPPDQGGDCMGYAGMQVPNCDFSRPPSYSY